MRRGLKLRNICGAKLHGPRARALPDEKGIETSRALRWSWFWYLSRARARPMSEIESSWGAYCLRQKPCGDRSHETERSCCRRIRFQRMIEKGPRRRLADRAIGLIASHG